MREKSLTSEEQVQPHSRYFINLMWHAGAYLVIGILLVVLDLLGPGWLNWSFWILGFWGFALAFHVLSYLIKERQLEHRQANTNKHENRRGPDHIEASDNKVAGS